MRSLNIATSGPVPVMLMTSFSYELKPPRKLGSSVSTLVKQASKREM